MKNFTLFVIAILFTGVAGAAIVNNSFENWQTDTTRFLGYTGIPLDTTSTYQDPAGWTSTNSISAIATLGNRSFVTQSSNATHGNYAVQLKTDSLIEELGKSLVIPGFMLNGQYQINISSFVLGTNITPLSIKGAGQPFTKRLADINGYFNYAPVLNPNTNGNDTCLIWATLRKGDELIADAIFKSTLNTVGYQYFNVPFNYVSCDLPDTLVILISSSIPNIPSLFGGQSNLVKGSILLVDTIGYDTLSADYRFAPFAFADFDTTVKNTAVSVPVKANDADCSNPVSSLTIAVTTQPVNGTATVNQTNDSIIYTPNNNYVGTDTLYYTLSDGTYTSDAAPVVVLVKDNTGITEVSQIPVFVYPVPATDELNIRFENKGETTARVYDVIGNLAATFPLNGNNNVLPLSGLSNGAYILQIVNDKNQALTNARFVVNR